MSSNGKRYVVGNKSDESFVSVSPIYSLDTQLSIENIKNIESISKEISIEFIDAMWLSPEDSRQIEKGNYFILTWENNQIVGVSFPPEDTRPYVVITLIDNKREFIADGVDYVEFDIRLKTMNDQLIEIDYNGYTDVITPTGVRKIVQLNFVKGVCIKKVKTLTSGMWTLPSVRPIGAPFRFKDDQEFYEIRAFEGGELL